MFTIADVGFWGPRVEGREKGVGVMLPPEPGLLLLSVLVLTGRGIAPKSL